MTDRTGIERGDAKLSRNKATPDRVSHADRWTMEW